DRQIIQAKAGEYATAYQRGGLRALADTVRAEQSAAPERLFVRVVDRGAEAIVLSQPEGWEPSALETATLQLWDGTLVQVGKSTEAPRAPLGGFGAARVIVPLSIVTAALPGGFITPRAAPEPVQRLTEAVGRIIRTGRTDERVPLAVSGEP